MMCFMHVYLGYTQPLFVQALMGIKNLYDAKPVSIHLFGKPAEGDLKRPFKVVSLFGGTVHFLPAGPFIPLCPFDTSTSFPRLPSFEPSALYLPHTLPMSYSTFTNTFPYSLGSSGPQTDNAAIAEAEKRASAKKEE
jgi:hypothetical protein